MILRVSDMFENDSAEHRHASPEILLNEKGLSQKLLGVDGDMDRGSTSCSQQTGLLQQSSK